MICLVINLQQVNQSSYLCIQIVNIRGNGGQNSQSLDIASAGTSY